MTSKQEPKKRTYPTEDDESKTLAQMLDLGRYRYTHIANEMQGTWGARMRAKRLGVRPGFPDDVILNGKELVIIELKRMKGGKTSDEQKQWIEALSGVKGVRVGVCKGAEEAMKFLKYPVRKLKVGKKEQSNEMYNLS